MTSKLDGPLTRTPLAHVTGVGGWNLYQGGVCARVEVNLMECLEAYGYDKGRKYCSGYVEDLFECRFKRKQIKRRDAMELERKKMYKAGEIPSQYVPTPDPIAY